MGRVLPAVRLPLCVRVVNGSSAPGSAPQLSLADAAVYSKLLEMNRPVNFTMPMVGNGSIVSPLASFAQTANHANSANPSSATLSNTVAGYTTLGGRFQFSDVAGAATDYALFAFTVPAGYKLFVTDIHVSSVVTNAAMPATAKIFDWSIATECTACLLYTSPSPRDLSTSRMPSSA